MVDLRKNMGKPTDFKYYCMEDFVLQHGKQFESKKLSQEERDYVNRLLHKRSFPIKQCFSNTFMLVGSSRNSMIYTEGFFLSVIPIHHAWASYRDAVIDPTIRLNLFKKEADFDRVIGEIPETLFYYGVKFDWTAVKKYMVGKKATGSMLDDWKQNRWSALRGELDAFVIK